MEKKRTKYFKINNQINLQYGSVWWVAGISAEARAVKIKNTIRRRRRSTRDASTWHTLRPIISQIAPAIKNSWGSVVNAGNALLIPLK